MTEVTHVGPADGTPVRVGAERGVRGIRQRTPSPNPLEDTMTRGLTLALVNLSLLAGLTLAAADGFAQVAQPVEQPTTAPVISTTCGTGTLTQCGHKNLYQCEWSISFNINPLTYSGGFSFARQKCVVSGTIPLYKDATRMASCPVTPGTTWDAGEWYADELPPEDVYYEEECTE